MRQVKRDGSQRDTRPEARGVSVALATFNSAAFILRQLESIVAQQPPASEIVVADDGSDDGTLAIVAAIRDGHSTPPEIRVAFKTRVGGVRPNFERALRNCTEDVLVLCDHDDVWLPGRLAVSLAALHTDRPALVFGDAHLIDASGVRLGRTLFTSLRVTRRERRQLAAGRVVAALVRRNLVTGATAMFNRRLLDLALPFPESWVHDEWIAAIAAAMGTVTLVDQPLIEYRIHGGNQIGVAAPGLLARARRAASSTPDRFDRLHKKFSDLEIRLIDLGAPPESVALVRRKVAFEQARREYPRRRLARAWPILRQLGAGRYRRFASQGSVDSLRDLWQAPVS